MYALVLTDSVVTMTSQLRVTLVITCGRRADVLLHAERAQRGSGSLLRTPLGFCFELDDDETSKTIGHTGLTTTRRRKSTDHPTWEAQVYVINIVTFGILCCRDA